jgi:uncharacterized SAM-binding protein YcdF (DUF218 family)
LIASPLTFLPLRGRTRRVAALAALAAVLLAGSLYAFFSVGEFLAREDPLERGDAIFVFAGTLIERPLEAAELYSAGYAPLVVLTRATAEQAITNIEKRGISVPTTFDLSRDVLLQLGVPEEALIAPDMIHDNTAEEARTLRMLASRHAWRRVIVVSSKYHMRRASLACSRALRGTGVEIVMRASRYDPSRPGRWWTTRSDIRWVASELPRFIAYRLGVGM